MALAIRRYELQWAAGWVENHRTGTDMFGQDRLVKKVVPQTSGLRRPLRIRWRPATGQNSLAGRIEGHRRRPQKSLLENLVGVESGESVRGLIPHRGIFACGRKLTRFAPGLFRPPIEALRQPHPLQLHEGKLPLLRRQSLLLGLEDRSD